MSIYERQYCLDQQQITDKQLDRIHYGSYKFKNLMMSAWLIIAILWFNLQDHIADNLQKRSVYR